MTGETKTCPYCGGEILADATKCKHCREFLHAQSAPGRNAGRELCHEQKYRKHRLWLAVPVFIALTLSPIAPAIPLWFGIMLFVLCTGAFVPVVQRLSRYLMRLDPSEKWRSGLRLTACSLVGLLLVLASCSGAEYRKKVEAQNAQVEELTRQATEAIQIGNIALARDKISAALLVPDASELAVTRKLDEQIATATDPARVRAVLMDVPDDAFARLKKEGAMPTPFVSGYEKLDKLTAELVLAQIPEVAAARERRAEARRKEERKKKIERLFSAWDGSHPGLTRTIKAMMNNPKSYEHVETVCWDAGGDPLVRTTYRGTNAFGGVVTNWVEAKVDLDGNVLAIVEQGP